MQDYTFKELDERHRAAKGTAFRAFKRVGAALREGEDFVYVSGTVEPGRVAALREAGRLYRSSLHAVLVTPCGYERLRPFLVVDAPAGPAPAPERGRPPE